jgi:hypothetical protein
VESPGPGPAADRWPDERAFRDAARLTEASDLRARCLGVAICDDRGEACLRFAQGDVAHVFCEFEVLEDIEVPACGLVLATPTGVLAHGKNTFHHRADVPRRVAKGRRVRWHHEVRLDLGPGSYSVGVGFASTDAASWDRYREGRMGDAEFNRTVRQHSRVETDAVLTIGPNRLGQTSFRGITDLDGTWRIAVTGPEEGSHPARTEAEPEPVWLLIGHPHGGGAWLRRVIAGCVPDRLASPPPVHLPFSSRVLRPGRVYADVVVSREYLADVRPAGPVRHLVVLRDLRDTLVAAYLALKAGRASAGADRGIGPILRAMDAEDGVLHVMDSWLPSSAALQLSWLGGPDPVFRYEELRQDEDALVRALREDLGLPCERASIVRAAGEAEATGVAGAAGAAASPPDPDPERPGLWRDVFTPRLDEAFKGRFGDVLVASGHERDDSWHGSARRGPSRVPGRPPGLVYVSSYPRSGNTWIRNLVHHYFHRRVPSLYPEGAPANLPAGGSIDEALYTYPLDPAATRFARAFRSDVGRVFSDEVRRRAARSFEPLFLKTHEPPPASIFDGEAVIYVVRHPAAVVWSYLGYLRHQGHADVSAEDVIRGRVPYGSWSDAVGRWLDAASRMGERFLLARYEELAGRPEELLDRIAALSGLRMEEPAGSFPSFAEWHERAPEFYRAGDDRAGPAHLSPAERDLVQALHGPTMARLGYRL